MNPIPCTHTMTTNTEALDLAGSTHLAYRVGWQRRAAAELRRLSAVEAERDALRAALNLMIDAFIDTEGNHGPEQQEAMSAAFAAMEGPQA